MCCMFMTCIMQKRSFLRRACTLCVFMFVLVCFLANKTIHCHIKMQCIISAQYSHLPTKKATFWIGKTLIGFYLHISSVILKVIFVAQSTLVLNNGSKLIPTQNYSSIQIRIKVICLSFFCLAFFFVCWLNSVTVVFVLLFLCVQ